MSTNEFDRVMARFPVIGQPPRPDHPWVTATLDADRIMAGTGGEDSTPLFDPIWSPAMWERANTAMRDLRQMRAEGRIHFDSHDYDMLDGTIEIDNRPTMRCSSGQSAVERCWCVAVPERVRPTAACADPTTSAICCGSSPMSMTITATTAGQTTSFAARSTSPRTAPPRRQSSAAARLDCCPYAVSRPFSCGGCVGRARRWRERPPRATRSSASSPLKHNCRPVGGSTPARRSRRYRRRPPSVPLVGPRTRCGARRRGTGAEAAAARVRGARRIHRALHRPCFVFS
jgi:hypothetical protein